MATLCLTMTSNTSTQIILPKYNYEQDTLLSFLLRAKFKKKKRNKKLNLMFPSQFRVKITLKFSKFSRNKLSVLLSLTRAKITYSRHRRNNNRLLDKNHSMAQTSKVVRILLSKSEIHNTLFSEVY